MKPNRRLKQARERRGWSQERVAEQIGTSARNISRWERGFSFPYPYYREKLCSLFELDARALGLLPEATVPSWSASTEPASAQSTVKRSASLLDPAIPHIAKPLGLIGREGLLTDLRARLSTGEHVVLTALHGLPGVGKTSLALALVADP